MSPPAHIYRCLTGQPWVGTTTDGRLRQADRSYSPLVVWRGWA